MRGEPTHTGELLEAVATGKGLTVTEVDAVPLQPVLLLVTVRVYVPAIRRVALVETVGLI